MNKKREILQKNFNNNLNGYHGYNDYGYGTYVSSISLGLDNFYIHLRYYIR